MKIILHNSYYTDNYGDVLLSYIYDRWVREIVPGVEVAMPLLPASLKTLYGTPSTGLRSCVGANALLYVGGGYLGEPTRATRRWLIRNIMRHSPPAIVGRIMSTPLAINGVGVGPISYREGRRLAVRLFEAAQSVTVRDRESKAYIVEYGIPADRVQVTADAALTLRRGDIPQDALDSITNYWSDAKGSTRVGLHLTPELDRFGLQTIVADLLDFLALRPDVDLVMFADSNRRRVMSELHGVAAQQLIEKLPERARIYHYQEPWTLSALLASLDLVITTKLHVGIVASALDTLVLAFPAHQKTPRFYTQIGASDRCLSLDSLARGDALRMFTRWAEGRWSDYVVPAEARDASMMNRDVLEQFLAHLN